MGRPDRLTRNLLLFWCACVVLFVVGWTWRPPGPQILTPPSLQSQNRPECADPPRPPETGSLPERVLGRVILHNQDSWKAMRTAVSRVHERPGEPLYDAIFEQCIKFQYPPSSLLVLDYAKRLFGDRVLSNPVLNTFSLLLLGVMVWAIWRIYVVSWPGAPPAPLWHHLVPVLFTLTCYPVLKSLELGQIQTWLNALFAVSVLLYFRGSRLAAGILLGFVATVKPQMALLLPWALLRRDWAFAKGMAGCGALVLSLSLVSYGLTPHLEYVEVLSKLSRHGESYFANQSFNGMMLRALQLGPNIWFEVDRFAPYHPVVHIGTMLTTVLLVGLAMFSARDSHREQPALNLVLAGLAFTMGSPIAWEHHYGILPTIFAVCMVAVRAKGAFPRWLWIVFAASWVLTAVRFAATLALRETSLNFVQSHVYFGGLLLLLVLYWVRRAQGPGEVYAFAGGSGAGAASARGSGASSRDTNRPAA